MSGADSANKKKGLTIVICDLYGANCCNATCIVGPKDNP